MKGKKWLSALLVAALAVTLAPSGGQVKAADDPAVAINNMASTVTEGDRTEFGVTTTGSYTEGKVVGKFHLTAGDSSGVSLEYYETAGNEGWKPLTGDTFGPGTGFPYTDGATSKFAVTFSKPGTYTFAVTIVNVTTNAEVASTSQTVTVNAKPAADIEITNCGPWGESWLGAYDLGWKYINGFDTAKITSIRVGMVDKHKRTVVEYTADAEQVAWQKTNGYITADGLSSAPFYKEHNGTVLEEGRDSDWTVAFGSGYNTWQPAKFYVEVTADGTTYYKEAAYEGNFSCVHEFAVKTAAKAPTCTEPGNVAYWYCKECGKYFNADMTEELSKEELVIPATGHDAVKVEAKEPTADKAGNIEYWYCEVCGKYFSDAALTTEISKEETILAATGDSKEEAADQEKEKDETPKTGDASNILLWAALLVVAGGTTVYMRKRAR